MEKAKFNDRLQVTEFGLGRGADNMNLWKINLEYGELQTNGTVDTSKNTGNLAKQTISFEGLAQPFVQTYKYDSLYRLKEAKETNNNNQNWIQNFDYDRYGNRTTVSEDIAGKAPFVVNNITHPTIDQSTNRFDDNQGYLYDKVGNLTRDVTPSHSRQITFDGNNKQTKIENVDSQGTPIGAVGEYFYDGDGQRVKKVIYDSIGVHKETVIFVYSNGKLAEEFSTIPPQPSEADTKYVATDHLQSVRAISNQDGEIASRRDFLPFGEELPSETNLRKSEYKYASSEDTIRQKFTGYESDSESGLDYAQARMYNNQHARFTAVDPLLASGKSGNPQTFNRYVYVMNSPLQYRDPDGLQVGSDNNPGCDTTTENCAGTITRDTDGNATRLNFFNPLFTVDVEPEEDISNLSTVETNDTVLGTLDDSSSGGGPMFAFINPNFTPVFGFFAKGPPRPPIQSNVRGRYSPLPPGYFSSRNLFRPSNLPRGPLMLSNPNNRSTGNTAGVMGPPSPARESLPILNPHLVPNATRVLQNITNDANYQLGKTPNLATTVLSPREYGAGNRHPWLFYMQYGNAVERMVAAQIESSPTHRRLFRYVGGPNNPDFVGRGAYRGINFDITTPLQINRHLARPGYGNGLQVITYQRPANLRFFSPR